MTNAARTDANPAPMAAIAGVLKFPPRRVFPEYRIEFCKNGAPTGRWGCRLGIEFIAVSACIRELDLAAAGVGLAAGVPVRGLGLVAGVGLALFVPARGLRMVAGLGLALFVPARGLDPVPAGGWGDSRCMGTGSGLTPENAERSDANSVMSFSTYALYPEMTSSGENINMLTKYCAIKICEMPCRKGSFAENAASPT